MNKQFINFFKKQKELYSFCRRSIRNIATIVLTLFVAITIMFSVATSFIYGWLSDNQKKEVNPKIRNFIESTINFSSSNNTNINNIYIRYDNNIISLDTSLSISQKLSRDNFLNLQNLNITLNLLESIKNFSIPLDVKISGLNINLDKINYKTKSENKQNPWNKGNLYKKICNKVKFFT
ncbi:MAG: hypothetical protein K0T99_03035, partial [Alphaproteobacteria bacterium]|nr:hypothetical protein [Alphaproteobacteria bacterium]